MSSSITETIKELIEGLVKKIVDHPSEINVQVTCTTKSVLVQVKCCSTDIGKIIGRHGRIIESMKIIAIAVKNTQFLGDKKDIFIEIIEDENSDFLNQRQ